jgi:hypothetical protein
MNDLSRAESSKLHQVFSVVESKRFRCTLIVLLKSQASGTASARLTALISGEIRIGSGRNFDGFAETIRLGPAEITSETHGFSGLSESSSFGWNFRCAEAVPY